MTVSRSFSQGDKEDCHGGRAHAGEVFRVGTATFARGKGTWSPGWPTVEASSHGIEGHLVCARNGLSLERCAPGDGLLWRNRTHAVASLGAFGNLGKDPSRVFDPVESRETASHGNRDH